MVTFGFLSDPLSRPVPKQHWYSKQWYELQGDLVYVDVAGRSWKVPRGFVHDFASIPRPLWWLLTPQGPYSRAAVLHDFYHCDKLFLEAMKTDGTPEWLANLMFAVVAHPPKDEDDITAPPEDESII